MNTDCMAEGHCEGEGVGGGCPSEAETTSILRSEWEEVHCNNNNLPCSCCVALSMEKKFPLQVRGGGGPPPCPPPLNTALTGIPQKMAFFESRYLGYGARCIEKNALTVHPFSLQFSLHVTFALP